MSSAYLIAYNSILCGGWAYCFYLTIMNSAMGGSVQDLWKVVEVPLKIFQTAAFLEIVHSAIGLVRSPLHVTTMQVFSRIWIVWGIINPVKYATTTHSVDLFTVGATTVSLGLTSLLVAWSLAEIIRYSFFALKELEVDSYLSKWLRYTGFIALYPMGVSSELSIVYMAMPFIKTTHLWSIEMPNVLNFGFSYHLFCILLSLSYLPFGVASEMALVFLALPALYDTDLWSISMPNSLNFAFSYYIYVIVYSSLYLPFFPMLYFYMLAQRKKTLGVSPSPSKSKDE